MIPQEGLHWVDGVCAHQVDIRDRGFQYGHGVFETIVVKSGIPQLLQEHFSRLALGLSFLSIQVDQEHIKAFIEKLTAQLYSQSTAQLHSQCGDYLLKLTVTAGVGGRGYSYQPLKALWCVSLYPLPDFGRIRADGFQAIYCQHRMGARFYNGIKHLNCLDSVIAAGEIMRQGADEGLLLNEKGDLIEGSKTNLFLRFGDNWLTPDLACYGVKGVMRAWVMHYFRMRGVPIFEQEIQAKRALEADEIFCCNSVMGIVPLTVCEGVTFDISPTTRELQKQTQAFVC